MRDARGLVLRLGVTVGLLGVLIFVVADPAEVAGLVAGADPLLLLAAVLLSLVDRALMAAKWWMLLRVRALDVDAWTAFRCYLASSLYGLVLPVTVGADAVRVLALRHLGVLEVTASIVVERALGVLAMGSVALLSAALLTGAVAGIDIRSLSLWLVAAVAGLTGLFVASLLLADRWAAAAPATGPSLLRKAAEAYGRYRRHPAALTVFYLLSVLESLLSALIGFAAARALGLDLPLPLLVATVPLALASARLPISLGGFGVQEASFVFLAGLVGVSATDALSVMLLSDLAMLIALLPSAFDTSMLTLRREAVREAGDAARIP